MGPDVLPKLRDTESFGVRREGFPARAVTVSPPPLQNPASFLIFLLFYLLFLVDFAGSPWPPTLPSTGAVFFSE